MYRVSTREPLSCPSSVQPAGLQGMRHLQPSSRSAGPGAARVSSTCFCFLSSRGSMHRQVCRDASCTWCASTQAARCACRSPLYAVHAQQACSTHRQLCAGMAGSFHHGTVARQRGSDCKQPSSRPPHPRLDTRMRYVQ